MTKVLVTGATGYIGSHVVTALAELQVEVIALSRREQHPDPRVTSLVCDFTQLAADDIKRLGPPDVAIHLAWANGFQHNATTHIDALAGHVHFVSRLVEAGTLHFAGLGTMHEIGYFEGAIDETTPSWPRSYYGVAKSGLREAARLQLNSAEGIFQWLRAYYIFGDDRRSQSIFSKILAWEAEGQASFPFNSGKNQYDFISVTELARQIAIASLQTQVQGIIECCSGQPTSLGEKVEQFIAEHGLKIRPDYGAFPDRPYDSPAVWGNAAKINEALRSFEFGEVR